MEKTLEEMTDEALYLIMREQQPSLVDAIVDLLAAGQSPAQIETRIRQRYGNIQTVCNVRHIAEHLAKL